MVRFNKVGMKRIAILILILLSAIISMAQVSPYGTRIYNNLYIVKGTDTIWFQQDGSYAQFYSTKDFKINEKVRITDSLFGSNAKFTGKVQGVTITDGVAVLTLGALRSATDIIASDTVKGGTIFDGTAYLTSGALRGATDVIASDTIKGNNGVFTGRVTGTDFIASDTVRGATIFDGTAYLTSGALRGATDIIATDTVKAGKFYDGTLWISSGAVRGATDVIATDTIKAGIFYDGTARMTSGALRGVTDVIASDTVQAGTLSVGPVTILGGRVSGITDLFASDTIQAGTFFDGYITVNHGDIRGIDTLITGYLKSSSTYFTGPAMMDDPGTSANSHLFSMRADNATNVQTASFQVIYGADPYLRISAPEDAGSATPVLDLKDQMISLFNGASGVDYYLYFNGQSNQGTITYMEDEDRFDFDNAIRFVSAGDGTASWASNNLSGFGSISGTTLIMSSTGSFGGDVDFNNNDLIAAKLDSAYLTNMTWLMGRDYGGDTLHILRVDTSGYISFGAPVLLGALKHLPDAGLVTRGLIAIDTAASGSLQGMNWIIGANAVLELGAYSDGASGSYGDYVKIGKNIIYTPTNTGNIVAANGITYAILAADMRYNGGSAIDISADPQIADGTDGMVIKIIGLSDANTLTLDDGTGLQLSGGNQFVIGSGDVICLTYVASLDLWIECWRSNN